MHPDKFLFKLVRSHWDFGIEIIITSIMNTLEEKILYYHEALKMPHTMIKSPSKEATMKEIYKALKFSNLFPIISQYFPFSI